MYRYCGIISLLLLFLASCTSPLAKMGDLLAGDYPEQYFSDSAEHYSVSLPLEWKREEIPVSSPAYHARTTHWRISSNTAGKTSESRGSFSISTHKESAEAYAMKQGQDPQQATEIKLNFATCLQFASGPEEKKRIELYCQGRQNLFILDFALINPDKKIFKQIDRIMDSFNELPLSKEQDRKQ